MVFARCVESLVAIEHPSDCEVRWFFGRGWCQARRRNHAAQQALDWEAEYIATLDLDQIYEPDILARLLQRHFEGIRLVAAMVPMRGYVKSGGVKPFGRLGWKIEDGKFVAVDPEDGVLQRAEFPTSAAMMFRAEDLKRLSRPWYFFTYKPEDWAQVHGEDANFALRMLNELQVEGWVDTTIRVKHAHVFEIDETFSERFSDWSEKGVGDERICTYKN